MKTMMMTKRIDAMMVVCCLITALFCMVKISSDLEDGRACKIELDRERALRVQAQDIKVRMVEDLADQWCEDTIDQMESDLEGCNRLQDTSHAFTVELWEDYVKARLADCESRNLQTLEQRKACMGPAANPDEVMRALEALSIHQESKRHAAIR